MLAGPGSGKTHVLTLRCARLIYTEHVSPNKILVLAYNRAVVTELRNRLNHLFTRLGMSRTANRINVHT
ncbi:UvrD-helicase domain-containing protein, partial [Klebsiella pneumoniae]|nr:UvrD-helicase domain-containing protein [Klebsiella pneumoniae]